MNENSRGLGALEFRSHPRRVAPARSGVWRGRSLAVAIVLGIWQLVFWSGWKPEFVFPSPWQTFSALYDNWDILSEAAVRTIGRGFEGFAIALVIGSVVGALVSRIPVLRAAVGSMITGLQTMPSVAWFPAAIALFKLSEGAILFVVVIGAAPAIANGLINGIDNIPPVLLRAGRVMGASRFNAFRYVVLPQALPSSGAQAGLGVRLAGLIADDSWS
jgi:NitT/TauT family transport system permease protein